MMRQFARLSEFVSDLTPQTFLRWLQRLRYQWQRGQQRPPISQEQLNRLLSWFALDTDTAIVLTDPHSIVQWVNPAFTRLTGYSAAETIGTRAGRAQQGPDTSPEVLETMRKAILRGESFNVQLVNYTKLGKAYWVDIETRPIRNAAGEVEHFIATQKDITAQRLQTEQLKQAKAAAERLASDLAASRQQMRLGADAGGLSVWDWDLKGDRFWLSSRLFPVANEQWVENCGLRDLFTLAHEDDFPRVETTINQLLSVDPPPINEQFRMLVAGKWRWMNFRGAVSARDELGRAIRVSGTLLDETDRKLAEERAQADRDLLQSVIEHIPHAVFWKDVHGRYVGCNGKFANSLGLDSVQQVIGRTEIELRPNAIEAQAIAASDEDVIKSGCEIIAQPQQVFLAGHAKIEILCSKVPLRKPAGTVFGMLGIFNDITEQKRMERQLADARHLESIGRLAAGVAHEINTPMQYISDNIEFLSDSTEQIFDLLDLVEQQLSSVTTRAIDSLDSMEAPIQDASHRKLEFIREQVPKAIKDCLVGSQRVMEIVSAMKVFSHPGTNGFSQANINDLIESTTSITRNRWKYCAKVELDLEADLPLIRCLPGEINQVMVNLLVNAADAVQERYGADQPLGVINVRTRRVPDGITIEVRDNGCGIPEQNQSQIFSPFFTTKGVGKGTGQGLTLCYGVVCNKHGGSLTVESQVGQGTLFRIYLPNIPCPVVTESPESASQDNQCLC